MATHTRVGLEGGARAVGGKRLCWLWLIHFFAFFIRCCPILPPTLPALDAATTFKRKGWRAGVGGVRECGEGRVRWFGGEGRRNVGAGLI